MQLQIKQNKTPKTYLTIKPVVSHRFFATFSPQKAPGGGSRAHSSRDVVEKGGEGFQRLVAKVLKLYDQFLLQLVVDDGDRQRARLIRQKVAVVGALQMQLQI